MIDEELSGVWEVVCIFKWKVKFDMYVFIDDGVVFDVDMYVIKFFLSGLGVEDLYLVIGKMFEIVKRLICF